MRRRVRITTSFPSIKKVAKTLKVSKTAVNRLFQIVEQSQKAGKFVPPRVRRSNSSRRRSSRSGATRRENKIAAKRVA